MFFLCFPLHCYLNYCPLQILDNLNDQGYDKGQDVRTNKHSLTPAGRYGLSVTITFRENSPRKNDSYNPPPSCKLKLCEFGIMCTQKRWTRLDQTKMRSALLIAHGPYTLTDFGNTGFAGVGYRGQLKTKLERSKFTVFSPPWRSPRGWSLAQT